MNINEIIEHIDNRIAYLCGMETDVNILPMASVMINAGLEVKCDLWFDRDGQ